MHEIQNCLPAHAQIHFIRVRNSKWERAHTVYDNTLQSTRREAAARGSILSGAQLLKEWNLSQEYIGNLAKGCLAAVIETCNLYRVKLDQPLCDCVKDNIRNLLIEQQNHAIQNLDLRKPGAASFALNARQQLTGNTIPFFSEILIELERARIESIAASMQNEIPTNQTFNVTGPNSRVNIHSNDGSTNIVNEHSPFEEIRVAIESGVSDELVRAGILASLKDVETSTDRESGTKKYQAFIAAAASHMTIIGPFLPFLGHWVHSLAVAAK